MIPVFVDTAAWIALINVRDALHVRAQSVYDGLVQQRVPLVTSDFVLLEVADALGAPFLRPYTIAFINRLRRDVVEIVPLSEELMRKGWSLYSQRADKEWGLTDCTSFVIMLCNHARSRHRGSIYIRSPFRTSRLSAFAVKGNGR